VGLGHGRFTNRPYGGIWFSIVVVSFIAAAGALENLVTVGQIVVGKPA